MAIRRTQALPRLVAVDERLAPSYDETIDLNTMHCTDWLEAGQEWLGEEVGIQSDIIHELNTHGSIQVA